MQERTCVDCGADISDRRGNARRCELCAAKAAADVQRNRPPREARRRGVRLERRPCLACGAPFDPRREAQQTCSVRCRDWTQRHPGKVRTAESTCDVCGSNFAPDRQGQVYCSARCRSAAEKRRNREGVRPYVRNAMCATCGGDMPTDAKVGTKYCSVLCGRRDLETAARMAALTERACAFCGVMFMPRNWRNVTCSPRCSGMWHYVQNKDLYIQRVIAYQSANRPKVRQRQRELRWARIETERAKARAYYYANRDRFAVRLQTRRARKTGNRDSVGVSLRDWLRLVRRQHGLCAYCCKPTTDWHMEHVIPLSRGGRHAIGNIAATCPTCNLSKHDRLLTEWRYQNRKRGDAKWLQDVK